MKKLQIALLFVSILWIGTSCSSTYYIVRHAEKASEPKNDPRLTDRGEQRAENLVAVLRKKNIKNIYSSDFLRTRETVNPTAESKYLEIEVYNPADQKDFIEKLKKDKKNALISGHSNTIRYIINGLYEQEVLPKDLEDNEYGDLFIVKRTKSGKPKSFNKMKY